jgi:hypothetical protein
VPKLGECSPLLRELDDGGFVQMRGYGRVHRTSIVLPYES